MLVSGTWRKLVVFTRREENLQMILGVERFLLPLLFLLDLLVF